MELLQSNDIDITCSTSDELVANIDVSGVEMPPVNAGWARRTALRETAGSRYVEKYKADVQNLFDIGSKDSAKKLSPSGMREALLKMYPGRFDIPSESYIQKAISAVFQKQKSGNDVDEDIEGERIKMRQIYKDAIYATVQESGWTLKPAVGLEMIREQFRLPNMSFSADFPTRKQIKSRISSLKSKHKKDTFLPSDRELE